ncbi:MAG: hypothetical protein FWG85_05350 [Bacteroidetes bacterium]|nr:hypothetical protein [Bacteroidota bacterium]
MKLKKSNHLIGHDNKIQKRAIVDNGSQSKDVQCLSLTKKLKFVVAYFAIMVWFTSCMSENSDVVVIPDVADSLGIPIEYYIPPDILNKLSNYIPIHRGSKPPNIEGIFLVIPCITVYCSDGYYLPGQQVANYAYLFEYENGSLSTVYRYICCISYLISLHFFFNFDY